MLKVGITGGIGTGKSTVAKIFSILGIPIYEADARAKNLTEENEVIRKGIIELLGASSYTNGGKYNKRYVAEKVFENKNLLIKLNQIIHPVVIADYHFWVEEQDQNLPYVIKEAAIMDRRFSGVDKIIVVTSPLGLRVERIQKRDGRSRNEIENIIQNQKSETDYLKMADFEVRNDEENFLATQVIAIDRQLRNR